MISRPTPPPRQAAKQPSPRQARSAEPAPVLLSFCFCFVASACGGPAFPRHLRTTVHRMEEQGIDYSATGTCTLEISLDGAQSRARRTSHGVDVAGSDAYESRDDVTYDVRPSWSGDQLILALTPREGASPRDQPVTLTCERWTDAMQAAAGFDVPSAEGGVEWACALPREQIFALGRVVIEHVPREGPFILLSSTHQLVIEEDVLGQGGRTVRVRAGNPPR
jgi:hypothetical protein